jgi:hypothetical protein
MQPTDCQLMIDWCWNGSYAQYGNIEDQPIDGFWCKHGDDVIVMASLTNQTLRCQFGLVQ